jgi:hypothetical protein
VGEIAMKKKGKISNKIEKIFKELDSIPAPTKADKRLIFFVKLAALIKECKIDLRVPSPKKPSGRMGKLRRPTLKVIAGGKAIR